MVQNLPQELSGKSKRLWNRESSSNFIKHSSEGPAHVGCSQGAPFFLGIQNRPYRWPWNICHFDGDNHGDTLAGCPTCWLPVCIDVLYCLERLPVKQHPWMSSRAKYYCPWLNMIFTYFPRGRNKSLMNHFSSLFFVHICFAFFFYHLPPLT